MKARRISPYLPNAVPEVRERMLKELGLEEIDQLFSEVPEHLRFKGRLNLPDPLPDEYSIRRHLDELLAKNRNCHDNLCFLGAGCARHFIPAVCDEIAAHGQFLTAYSADPYADHGKWQALFEYFSLMAELLDLEVVGGAMYDGAQAAATAVRTAHRLTGRRQVLLPRLMNPETRQVIENYVKGLEEPVVELVYLEHHPESGLLDLADLKAKLGPQTAGVLMENPTFLGGIEVNAAEIGELVRAQGAEFMVYCDPISLGVLAPPAQYGATLACGDIHPLGIHLNCGGGQSGFIATPGEMRYIVELKDKMYGITETTVPGEYGFGHVLFDRTSFGSREKAKEFTGTGTNLWAITAGVYLSLMGPQGMAEVGRTIMARSRYAQRRLTGLPGVRARFSAPFFKEFVLDFSESGLTVAEINAALLERGIFGGLDLAEPFPELKGCALYCVTETITRQDIDRLVAALGEILPGDRREV